MLRLLLGTALVTLYSPIADHSRAMLPKFDPFLFASVGEEIGGVPLSVLSVLTRLDLDPREEAAPLSAGDQAERAFK